MPWVVSIFCTWWRDKRVAHAGGVQGDIPLPPFPSCPGIKASGPPDRASSEGTVGGGGGSGWKRKPCFPLLPWRVNHAPTAAIRFSSLQGGWCGAERASLDVPVSEEKGGVLCLGRASALEGRGEEGPSPPPPLLSLHIFNLNQNPALLPGSRHGPERLWASDRLSKLLLFSSIEKILFSCLSLFYFF